MEDLTLTLSPLGDDEVADVTIVDDINRTSCVARTTPETTGVCSVVTFDEPGTVSVTVRVEKTEEEVTVVLLPLLQHLLGDGSGPVPISEAKVQGLTESSVDVNDSEHIFIIKRENESFVGDEPLEVFVDFNYTPESVGDE